MALYNNTKMVFFGGAGASPKRFNDLWEIDLSDNAPSWTNLIADNDGSSPSQRNEHSVIVYGTKLILFGGSDGTDALNDLWEIDLFENAPSWKNVIANNAKFISSFHGISSIFTYFCQTTYVIKLKRVRLVMVRVSKL